MPAPVFTLGKELVEKFWSARGWPLTDADRLGLVNSPSEPRTQPGGGLSMGAKK